MPHKKHLFLSLFALIALGLAACGENGNDGSGAFATGVAGQQSTLTVLLMVRDVAVNDSRLPIVVLLADEQGTRLDNRLDDLSFSYRHTEDEQFSSFRNVLWREWPVRGGAYTAVPQFDRAGIWEVRVALSENGTDRVGSTFLQVAENSSAPGVGDPAPVTATKTATTIDEVRQISSAFDPDLRFYAISLDQALSSGKPTVVVFSSPAFCVTQTCGPQLNTLASLIAEVEVTVNFVHVEIFDNIREMLDTGDNSIGVIAEPVNDWGLITEPWTFFIDSTGTIRARFEQFTTADELTEAMALILPAS